MEDAPHGEITDHHGPSRRALLRVGGFAAAGAVATGTGIAAAATLFDRDAAAETPTRRAPALLSASQAARTSVAAGGTDVAHAGAEPITKHREPAWMHTWADPISRLDAQVSHRVGVRFPKRAIMLTIDDGPHPVWTPRYLRLLARHHVQATFSVIGEQVRGNEHLLKAMISEGHHIGNHTFHHPLNLPYLSAHAIRRELEDTTDAIVRASGFRPRQFRAPGGVWGPDVFREVSKQKMMPLGWDIDPRDWALPGVTAIRDAMLAARPHDIILCHDGGGDRSETYRALKTVIPALLARHWTFVTLPAPQ